jgi:hypothetical protein
MSAASIVSLAGPRAHPARHQPEAHLSKGKLPPSSQSVASIAAIFQYDGGRTPHVLND